MPTYEYACSACDSTHDVVQRMTDPTLTTCPSCGESSLRKLFSGVGIHFKGSGFYRTDSRDAKASSAAPSGGKDSGGKDSGGKDSGGKDSGGKESSSAPAASTPASSGKSSASAPAASPA